VHINKTTEEYLLPVIIFRLAHHCISLSTPVFKLNSLRLVSPTVRDAFCICLPRWLPQSHSGSLVNGFAYWTHTSKPYVQYMLVLTATMRFFRIDLPQYLMGQGPTFRVGETIDGKRCIVGAVVFSLLVWYWRPDDNGVDTWMIYGQDVSFAD
jgi:hypothetical protein